MTPEQKQLVSDVETKHCDTSRRMARYALALNRRLGATNPELSEPWFWTKVAQGLGQGIIDDCEAHGLHDHEVIRYFRHRAFAVFAAEIDRLQADYREDAPDWPVTLDVVPAPNEGADAGVYTLQMPDGGTFHFTLWTGPDYTAARAEMALWRKVGFVVVDQIGGSPQ
jgi:hypothetical protein